VALWGGLGPIRDRSPRSVVFFDAVDLVSALVVVVLSGRRGRRRRRGSFLLRAVVAGVVALVPSFKIVAGAIVTRDGYAVIAAVGFVLGGLIAAAASRALGGRRTLAL